MAQWIAEQLAEGSKGIFAWPRKGEARWAPGAVCKQQQLDEANQAWWELWGREALTEAQRACAFELISEETRMGQLSPLTGHQLFRAARSMGKRKAGGSDGSRTADWAQWLCCIGTNWRGTCGCARSQV